MHIKIEARDIISNVVRSGIFSLLRGAKVDMRTVGMSQSDELSFRIFRCASKEELSVHGKLLRSDALLVFESEVRVGNVSDINYDDYKTGEYGVGRTIPREPPVYTLLKRKERKFVVESTAIALFGLRQDRGGLGLCIGSYEELGGYHFLAVSARLSSLSMSAKDVAAGVVQRQRLRLTPPERGAASLVEALRQELTPLRAGEEFQPPRAPYSWCMQYRGHANDVVFGMIQELTKQSEVDRQEFNGEDGGGSIVMITRDGSNTVRLDVNNVSQTNALKFRKNIHAPISITDGILLQRYRGYDLIRIAQIDRIFSWVKYGFGLDVLQTELDFTLSVLG